MQAEALRLGVIEQIAAAARNGNGQRGASVVTRDGNRMVAIIRWAGFAKASGNGWASMAISPVLDLLAACPAADSGVHNPKSGIGGPRNTRKARKGRVLNTKAAPPVG